MAKSKKYDYRVTQDDTGWQVEIIRQVTLKKTVVSKKQSGFSNEAEAQAWARESLLTFSDNLAERNKRHAQRRQKKAELLAEKERLQASINATKLAERQVKAEETPSVWTQPKETTTND